ncbi:MAG: hypothetical protein ACRBCL_03455 [Maritimibacter sp.]
MMAVLFAFPAHADRSKALAWLQSQSETNGHWKAFGTLDFPSGQIFIGDPTWGDDYHIRWPQKAPADSVDVYVYRRLDGTNLMVWLEVAGTTPATRGDSYDFGVDAASFALGDLSGGQALVALGERWQDMGRGDSFEFIAPHLQSSRTPAKWLPIPGSNTRIFLAGTGTDGGFAGVWLYDKNGALSGILIDIRGNPKTGKYIDTALPKK